MHHLGEFEKQQIDIKSTKEDIKLLKYSCSQLEAKSTALEKQKTEMAGKLVNIEVRSMLENLICYGIPEQSQNDAQNDCDALIKDLITTKMDLDGHGMRLDRAHRLGGNRARKPRAIVVKFH